MADLKRAWDKSVGGTRLMNTRHPLDPLVDEEVPAVEQDLLDKAESYTSSVSTALSRCSVPSCLLVTSDA